MYQREERAANGRSANCQRRERSNRESTMKSARERCSHRWGHWFESSTAHHLLSASSPFITGACAKERNTPIIYWRGALWYTSTIEGERPLIVHSLFTPDYDRRMSYYTPETLERFWTKVAIAGDGDCWLWAGAVGGNGYGRFKLGYLTEQPHRIAWEVTHGEPLRKRFACHRCDTPLCVNPAHIYAGDAQTNMDDQRARDRRPRSRREVA